jgi:hypothetical protein
MAIKAEFGSYTWNTTPILTAGFVQHDFVAGHAIVVGISLADTTQHVVSVTDTKGHLYSFRYAATNTGVRTELWECQSTLAQTNNIIQMTFSAATVFSACYEAYSGVYAEPSLITQSVAYGPSPYGTRLSGGVVTSNIASWGVGVFGWASTQPDVFFFIDQGTLRQEIPHDNPVGIVGVGTVIVDVHGYPIAGNPVPGYGIDPPIGHVYWRGASVTPLEPVYGAAVVLELRSPGGLTPGTGVGGTVPPHPPYHPDPPGSRVAWSYSFIVPDSGGITGTSPLSAAVTCKYVGAGCSAPNNEFGNVAH